jgi:hypothetical protein
VAANNRLLIRKKKVRRNYSKVYDEDFHVDELYLESGVNQSLSLEKERSEKLIIAFSVKPQRKGITWVT